MNWDFNSMVPHATQAKEQWLPTESSHLKISKVNCVASFCDLTLCEGFYIRIPQIECPYQQVIFNCWNEKFNGQNIFLIELLKTFMLFTWKTCFFQSNPTFDLEHALLWKQAAYQEQGLIPNISRLFYFRNRMFWKGMN